MNYQKIYQQLIDNARSRIPTGYTESHHIVPRCLGGNDGEENLVELTAREHFIAHYLLARIHGGTLWHAAHMMSRMKKYSSRVYEKLRKEHAIQAAKRHTGKLVSEETRKKISENRQRAKSISKALKGRPKSESHKEAYRNARLKSGGWVVTEEHRAAISEKMQGDKNHMWGKTHSEEAKRKIAEANKQKIVCPHCEKSGGIAIMKRWHFDRCKKLTQ